MSFVQSKMNVNCLIDRCLQKVCRIQFALCMNYLRVRILKAQVSVTLSQSTSFILSSGRWTALFKVGNRPHNMSLGHSLLILSRNVH